MVNLLNDKEEWLRGLKRRSAKSLYRFYYIVGSNPTSSDFELNLKMFFYLKASSKDKEVLKKFVKFLSKLETSPISLKYFSKQKKRKFITILNSPHVNKTAQEQFEVRVYSKQFLINSFKPFSLLSLLKRIKISSFPGLKLEVKGIFNLSNSEKESLLTLDPDNICLISVNSPVCLLNIKRKYIQLFDCYGEIQLKTIK